MQNMSLFQSNSAYVGKIVRETHESIDIGYKSPCRQICQSLLVTNSGPDY